MVWLKHDDQFSSDPRVWKLTDKAYRVHMCALEWCCRELTDGVVDQDAVPHIQYAARAEKLQPWVKELVDNGLWFADGNMRWRIRNYLKYNRDKTSVENHRAENARRQAAWRQRNGVTDSVSNSVSNDALGMGMGNKKERCEICGNAYTSTRRLTEHLFDVHGIEEAA